MCTSEWRWWILLTSVLLRACYWHETCCCLFSERFTWRSLERSCVNGSVYYITRLMRRSSFSCSERRVEAHHSCENEGDLKSVREAAAVPNQRSRRVNGALKSVPNRSSRTFHRASWVMRCASWTLLLEPVCQQNKATAHGAAAGRARYSVSSTAKLASFQQVETCTLVLNSAFKHFVGKLTALGVLLNLKLQNASGFPLNTGIWAARERAFCCMCARTGPVAFKNKIRSILYIT